MNHFVEGHTERARRRVPEVGERIGRASFLSLEGGDTGGGNFLRKENINNPVARYIGRDGR